MCKGKNKVGQRDLTVVIAGFKPESSFHRSGRNYRDTKRTIKQSVIRQLEKKRLGIRASDIVWDHGNLYFVSGKARLKISGVPQLILDEEEGAPAGSQPTQQQEVVATKLRIPTKRRRHFSQRSKGLLQADAARVAA